MNELLILNSSASVQSITIVLLWKGLFPRFWIVFVVKYEGGGNLGVSSP